MLSAAIEKVARGEDLPREEARKVAHALLEEDVPDSVIGGLLVGLKTKGESESEIAGFAQGMRDVKVGISPGRATLVDTCGTGGDGSGTFNISTAAAIIAASTGVPVAKHGNRGVSSGCGSADVLEELGVDLEMSPRAVERCIREVGIGFMFAPTFHPAMKRVIGARRELGIPTIFNILGPLTNPAGAHAQVLGVNKPGLVSMMARVLRDLGCARAYVLYGTDGLDEFTLAAETMVCEVDGSKIVEYELTPEDLGLSRAPRGALKGGDAGRNAAIVRDVLDGLEGPALDVSIANAAFAVMAAGNGRTRREAVDACRRSVESGEAAGVLERLIDFGRRERGRGDEDVSR